MPHRTSASPGTAGRVPPGPLTRCPGGSRRARDPAPAPLLGVEAAGAGAARVAAGAAAAATGEPGVAGAGGASRSERSATARADSERREQLFQIGAVAPRTGGLLLSEEELLEVVRAAPAG